ncbi:MAG TPA: bifunctional enoyl-CoA hydratase/phosphate acetyltransferase [Tissierellales bacterium]|nr:bifunctional enoyl-CoA hydratase/phosphate acetyltransferase [Tissierellales bacterium]
MEINKLRELLSVEYNEKIRLVVVGSHDEEVLEAVGEASKLNIVEPILIGRKEEIEKIVREKNIIIKDWKIIDEDNLAEAAKIGVKLVGNNEADFIMKGIVDTGTLLKEVLNKEYGLRTDSLLSHVMIYEMPNYHKLIYLTDGGMNLNPNTEQKEKIIQNSVRVAKALGKEEVKIGCLAAKEKVDPKMVATTDALKLKEKSEGGYFGEKVIVDGPMALDLAVSKDAAKIKNYTSLVAGDADILLVPNIEMGNGIGKSITYFAEGKSAGIIMGAKVPIVLVSRADTHESKLYSIALGSIIAHKMNFE